MIFYALLFSIVMLIILTIDGSFGMVKLRLFEKAKSRNLTFLFLFFAGLTAYHLFLEVKALYESSESMLTHFALGCTSLICIVLSIGINNIRRTYGHGKRYKYYFLTSITALILGIALFSVLYIYPFLNNFL